MNPNTIHYMFDPNSIGWLHHRHKERKEIRKEDIIRLLEEDADNVLDPLLQDYLLPALKGELNGKRGRPPLSLGRRVRYYAASMAYEERLAEFQRERDEGVRVREANELEPSIQVAQEVADEFQLGCSGRSLLNVISRMKKAEQLI